MTKFNYKLFCVVLSFDFSIMKWQTSKNFTPFLLRLVRPPPCFLSVELGGWNHEKRREKRDGDESELVINPKPTLAGNYELVRTANGTRHRDDNGVVGEVPLKSCREKPSSRPVLFKLFAGRLSNWNSFIVLNVSSNRFNKLRREKVRHHWPKVLSKEIWII